MNKIIPIVVLFSTALLGGCSTTNNRPANNQITNQTANCGTIEVVGNVAAYTNLAVPEKEFAGILEDNGPEEGTTTRQRYGRYSLSGRELAPLSEDLSNYVGRSAIVVGKQYKFELEGDLLDELWAKSISCR